VVVVGFRLILAGHPWSAPRKFSLLTLQVSLLRKFKPLKPTTTTSYIVFE
jgi:hypothetical protein